MRRFFLVLYVLLTTAFLLEYKIVGQAVYGDGRYYWAFTRSLYADQNLDISDEMAHVYSPESNNRPASFLPDRAYADKTKIITNSFSLGISLVWLPFYAFADLLVVVLQIFGIPALQNGYSDIYQVTVGIGNIGFVVAGAYVLFLLLRSYFTQKTSMLVVILSLFATNLLYYGSLDVINSHPASFFLTTLLVWCFFQYREKQTPRLVFLLGILVGLMASNRTQDALFVILPLIIIVASSKRFVALGKKLGILLVGGILGYAPQIIIISLGQGSFAILPHTDQGFHVPQHFIGILLDPKLGVLWYMPIFLIGVMGVYLFRKQDRFVSLSFLTVIGLHYLMLASWAGWQQASYSMRYVISSIPLVAFGMGYLITLAGKRVSSLVIYGMVGIFILHQMVMIVSFKLFWQDSTTVGSELSQSGKLKEHIRLLLEKSLP